MLPRNKILLLFDVDGTLTAPRRTITEDMKSFLFDRIGPLATLGLVGGSDFGKIAEQMGGEKVTDAFDYVFCENGLVHYEKGRKISSQKMVEFIGENLSQKFINFCLRYMSDLTLPIKRGNFVEFRTGLVNICPIGRSCTQAERNEFAKYDKENNIREKFVEAMQKAFPDAGLKFAIGGEISIDVFPVGWDKTFCLRHVVRQDPFEQIHFFGDKTFPGGNDHEIYEDSRTIGHRVTSPENTKQQLIEFFNIKE